MSTYKVDVICIKELEIHPNADKLKIVRPFGFQVCVGLDEFQVGDLAAYIPPDSLIDTRRKEFSFLKREGRDLERIKVKRLRGFYSQGLLVKAPNGLVEGDDAAEILEVSHYEPPVTQADTEPAPLGIHAPIYDVENYRRYKHVLLPDELLVLTEKIHGCVQARTRISMANGSRKKITEIQVGDKVIGVHNGKVTTAAVLHTFKNGKTEQWLQVKGTRRGAERGNNLFSIFCTPQHHFWSPLINDFVVAERLKPGDTVTLLRSELGSAEQVYKPMLVEQKIVSVEATLANDFTGRYDIETETGNYFANGVLVHNSNIRVLYHQDRLWVGSHRQWKREGDNVFWRAVHSNQNLIDFVKDSPGIVAYCEAYGWVQDLRYGKRPNEVNIAVYDLWDGRGSYFWDWQRCVEVCKGLPWVPILGGVVTSSNEETILSLSEGKSLVPGADHVREGCVLRPVIERFNEEIKRVILKVINNAYLERA